MSYHQKIFHGHHRTALGYLGEKRNTRRKNGPWIYAIHGDPYTPAVNCGLTNQLVCCNADLECSGWFVALSLWGCNTVNQRGWILSMWTSMVLFHQSGFSTPSYLWRTYWCIQYSSSFCSDQIQSHRNFILDIGEVGCILGWTSLLIGCMWGSVLMFDMARLARNIRVN